MSVPLAGNGFRVVHGHDSHLLVEVVRWISAITYGSGDQFVGLLERAPGIVHERLCTVRHSAA